MKTKAICDLDNAPKQSPRSDCIITHAIQEQCHSSSYVFHERNHCDTSISTSTRNARQLVSSFCLSSANRVAKLWTLWVTASWRDLPREKHFQYMIWIVNLFLRRQRLEKCTVVSWGDFIFSWLIYVKRRKNDCRCSGLCCLFSCLTWVNLAACLNWDHLELLACNYKGNTFPSVILRLWVLVRFGARTLDLPHCSLALYQLS